MSGGMDRDPMDDRIRIRVPTTTKAEPEVDTLAVAITKISQGMKRLQASGVNRNAIVVLLCHETKLSRKAVTQVLDGLAELAIKYTTKEAA